MIITEIVQRNLVYCNDEKIMWFKKTINKGGPLMTYNWWSNQIGFPLVVTGHWQQHFGVQTTTKGEQEEKEEIGQVSYSSLETKKIEKDKIWQFIFI